MDGRLIVLGTDLRERAYRRLKAMFPESLLLLETARLGAWVGSDLGVCFAWLHTTDDPSELELTYILNMRDADDESVLAKLQGLIDEGHPVNWDDVGPQIAKGNLGAAPDWRPMFFRIPKSLVY